MGDWVFVDTCIWVLFFNKPGSSENAAVDDLLDANRVALVGPVLAELLLGFRRKDQASWVASRLRLTLCGSGLGRLASHWRLGREIAANCNKLPLTDLVLAVVARRCNAWVYTTDPHFDLIPGLKRYFPK